MAKKDDVALFDSAEAAFLKIKDWIIKNGAKNGEYYHLNGWRYTYMKESPVGPFYYLMKPNDIFVYYRPKMPKGVGNLKRIDLRASTDLKVFMRYAETIEDEVLPFVTETPLLSKEDEAIVAIIIGQFKKNELLLPTSPKKLPILAPDGLVFRENDFRKLIQGIIYMVRIADDDKTPPVN